MQANFPGEVTMLKILIKSTNRRRPEIAKAIAAFETLLCSGRCENTLVARNPVGSTLSTYFFWKNDITPPEPEPPPVLLPVVFDISIFTFILSLRDDSISVSYYEELVLYLIALNLPMNPPPPLDFGKDIDGSYFCIKSPPYLVVGYLLIFYFSLNFFN
jgi:hypothetical protein